MAFSLWKQPRVGQHFRKGRQQLQVRAVQAKGPKGRTPSQPEVPDPFDRHSSARDKAAGLSHGRANVSRSGSSFAPANRRRGRPAHLRSPDDSPLRDGNRDRAAKTLLVYLQETNPTVYHWLFCYLKENPIPQAGTWDEVSGEMFLRKMLSLPTGWTKMDIGRDELFDNIGSTGVDPRQMAQRIMEIRVQLSKEFIQDLTLLPDENSVLLRETLQVSLSNALEADPIQKLPPRDTSRVFVHPELLVQGGALHPEVAASHPELLPVVRDQAAKLQTQSTPSPSPDPRTPSPIPAPSAVPPSISTSPVPVAPPAPAKPSTVASSTANTNPAPRRKDSPAPRATLKPDGLVPPQSGAEGGSSKPKGSSSPKRPPTKPWSSKDIPGLYNPHDEHL